MISKSVVKRISVLDRENFNAWVQEFYKGKEMDKAPEKWNNYHEFLYRIGDKFYTIDLNDVPEKYQ